MNYMQFLLQALFLDHKFIEINYYNKLHYKPIFLSKIDFLTLKILEL